MRTVGCRRLWVLVSGLPPDSATWRRDQLPPLEHAVRELLKQTHGWGRSTVEMLAEGKTKTPGAPDLLAAPDEPDPTPARNVVSIADFVASNPNRAKTA